MIFTAQHVPKVLKKWPLHQRTVQHVRSAAAQQQNDSFLLPTLKQELCLLKSAPCVPCLLCLKEEDHVVETDAGGVAPDKIPLRSGQRS